MVNFNNEDKGFKNDEVNKDMNDNKGYLFEDVDFNDDVKEVHVYHHIVPPQHHFNKCEDCDCECDYSFECNIDCDCEPGYCQLEEDVDNNVFTGFRDDYKYKSDLKVNDDELDEYFSRVDRSNKAKAQAQDNAKKLGVILGTALLGGYVATQVKKGNIDKDILYKLKDVVPEKHKDILKEHLKEHSNVVNKVKDKAVNKVSSGIDTDKVEVILVKLIENILLPGLNKGGDNFSKVVDKINVDKGVSMEDKIINSLSTLLTNNLSVDEKTAKKGVGSVLNKIAELNPVFLIVGDALEKSSKEMKEKKDDFADEISVKDLKEGKLDAYKELTKLVKELLEDILGLVKEQGIELKETLDKERENFNNLDDKEKEEVLQKIKSEASDKANKKVSELLDKATKKKKEILKVEEDLNKSETLEDKKEVIKDVVASVKKHAENEKENQVKDIEDNEKEDIDTSEQEVDEARLEELAKVLENNNADLNK